MRKVPFLTIKGDKYAELSFELIENDFKRLDFLFGLLLSFLTFICYTINNFHIIENSNTELLKSKTFFFSYISCAVFFTLFIFLLFSKAPKTKFFLIIIILVIQEAFIIFFFISISKIFEGTFENSNGTTNNNLNNNDNNNYKIIESHERLEIYRNFFIFYTFHTFCFTALHFQITSKKLEKKIKINTFITFNIYKAVVFIILLLNAKLEQCFYRLFQETIFFVIILFTSRIETKIKKPF